jgi:probable HAF family extracellular repeat protein
MKIKMTWIITLVAAVSLAAQGKAPTHQYHHYQIVDPGTFGGPSSGLQAPFFPRFGMLNNRGTLVGFANTPASDAPFCGFGNCFAGDAFQLQGGVTIDLGHISGGFDSQANWISGNGLIAGLGDNAVQDPLAGFPIPYLHGLLWDHGIMTDLGTLPEGGNLVFPIGVNNLGEVVGSAQNTVPDPNSMFPGYPTQTRAFYWKNGVMQDLGTLGTGTDATAALINERGQVVGWSYTNSTPSAICAGAGFGFGFALTTGSFIWDARNGMRDIGGLGGSCTIATDLNNRGQIVGLSALPGDLVMHPFVWDAATGMTDLLGASSALTNPYFSLTINEHGVVAGSAIDADFTFFAPFLWRQVGGKWKQTSLGVDSITTSINASDQVIGYGNVSFLWEGGGPAVDLNTLVPPNSGLQIYETDQINDRGEIAAQASDADGNNHALLLIPCDGNHPGVVGCDYSLVDASTAPQSTAPRLFPNPTLRPIHPQLGNRPHIRGMQSQGR